MTDDPMSKLDSRFSALEQGVGRLLRLTSACLAVLLFGFLLTLAIQLGYVEPEAVRRVAGYGVGAILVCALLALAGSLGLRFGRSLRADPQEGTGEKMKT